MNMIFWEMSKKILTLLVYQLFNLTSEQINEVEIWFARRYPKLAKYAYIKPKEELVKEEKLKKFQAAGTHQRTYCPGRKQNTGV
jgi:hypothetical protein